MPLVLYSLRELASALSLPVNLLLLLWLVGLNCCDLKQTLAGRQAHRHTGTQEARQGAGLLIVKPLLDFSDGGPS